jgi:hypothetical protein
MNKPYNIQNTNICNGIFHISFFKALTFIVWHLIKCVKFLWTIHTVWWEVICTLLQHLGILFWFPQCTHYFWRVLRFLFMERKQDYNVTICKKLLKFAFLEIFDKSRPKWMNYYYFCIQQINKISLSRQWWNN